VVEAVVVKPSLTLLQGFELSYRGVAVELPPAAQKLIAFLAMQSRPVQRLFVASTLWIDAGEERANASLRSTLWRLGRVNCDIVRAAGTMLVLAPDVVVDTRVATTRARRIMERPDDYCRQDIDLLGRRGELLADWYEDWVLIERERLRELRVRALESLSRALAATGEAGMAAEAALAAIGCEPLRESANRALVAAYMEEGNLADALRAYELYREQLVAALGLKPSARMEMLVAPLRCA
jgi:DNA-binding SARP family transcriptional activator